MARRPHAGQATRSDRSSLGYKAQEFDDGGGLKLAFEVLKPAAQPPSFIRCMKTPPGTVGAVSCKSVFCPRCHAQRQRELRSRLLKTMKAAERVEAGMMFVTLTIPHDGGEALDITIAALNKALKSSRTGAGYKRLRSHHGLWGIINVWDLTRGPQGWHFHVHAVLIAKTQMDVEHCASELKSRYESALDDLDRKTTSLTADVRPIYNIAGLAGYLTKSWKRKTTTNGGKTPFAVLSRASRGCLESAELLFEAFYALKGKPR